MGVIKIIYDLLALDQQLDSELSRSVFDVSKEKPAIYELFPGKNSVMPYIITRYNFPAGDHWANVNGSLTVSIFVGDRDSVKAERIKERIIELLDRQQIQRPEKGLLRIYKGPNDQPGGAESPDVVHWIVDFDIKFWRANVAN